MWRWPKSWTHRSSLEMHGWPKLLGSNAMFALFDASSAIWLSSEGIQESYFPKI